MNPEEISPQEQLMKFITGKWISKPIYVAAELGIADMLSDGPESIESLAKMSHAHAPALYRVMRALASVGIFAELEDKLFDLTSMAECLKTGAMRSIILMFNADWNDRAWGYLMDSVKTGNTAFEKAHGMPLAAWLEKPPHVSTVFNEANAIKAAGSHRAVVDVYDFSGTHTLTDVGGGLGILVAEILTANPHMKGVVADLPVVVREAEKVIRAHGLQERIKAVACDFFEAIPKGSDAYLMSHVLHDWPDDRCKAVLKNCLRAMHPKAKLVIVEMIVPPGNEPSVAKLLDLEMLVITGGRERTEAEFSALLEASGLRLTRVISTQESISVMEAVRL